MNLKSFAERAKCKIIIMRQTQESNLRMLTQVLCYKWFPRREEHSLVSNFDNSDAMRKNWLRWCYNEGSIWTFLDFVRRSFLGGILPFLLDLTLAVAPRGLPKTQRWIPIVFTSPKPIQWSWWENIWHLEKHCLKETNHIHC